LGGSAKAFRFSHLLWSPWRFVRLAANTMITANVDLVVIAGTNGEAATLTSAEKTQLVQKARSTAERLGRGSIPIVLGCSAGCTRDVIDQTVEAKAAGADVALVLVPSYFHFAMDQAAIIAFFEELADASPIPIMIYNFPGVVAGLDVNSEMLSALGKHKNIIAVKLTCGGIAKVARVAAEFSTSEFCALAGQSDWLIPALSVGGTGCITGVANLFPKVRPPCNCRGRLILT
jgi:4-hydroxy-2-oxoglutarate aldolase